MKISELRELLLELAENDLSEDANIYDHPCSVAVRVIDEYENDIDYLRAVISGAANKKSKRATTLLKMGCRKSF